MPLVNKRVYDEVQGLLFAGAGLAGSALAIGGVTSISVEEGYESIVRNSFDGAQGPTAHEHAKAFIRSTIRTTDVLKMIDLLISVPGAASAEWLGPQSGAATFIKGTLAGYVFHALDFTANEDFAVASLQAQHRFANSNDDFEAVHTFVTGVAGPVTRTHPDRLYRIKTCTHGGQAILHIQNFSFRLAARLITDSGDADVGQTAIERGDFNDISVTLGFRDSTKHASGSYDLATQLLKAGPADLVVTLDGAGELVDKKITLRNCKFTNRQRSGQEGWTGFTLQGSLVFRDPADPWTIRTVNHATAATRLIDVANAA